MARLTSRRFGGYESLQLDIRDVALSGSHPEATALVGRGASGTARRGARMTDPVRADPPRAGDPYGTGIVGTFLAPGLAIVGLLIVAIFTVTLLNGQLPFAVGQTPGGNGGTGNDGPDRTPAPSNVVVVPEAPQDEPSFTGAITYAKAGNIWVQTADGAIQLTDNPDAYASMPSWSPDGQYVYYIETKHSRGFWPVEWTAGNV